jgi:hypothetical protein
VEQTLEVRLKAVLGWLYSANQADKNVQNAMTILMDVIKNHLPKETK